MALPIYATKLYRAWDIIFKCICAFVFFFLIAPIIVIIPLSFNAQDFFTFTPEMLNFQREGYSLKHYNDFLQVASEVGIFGLLAYMCVFLIPILGSIKHIFTSKNKLIGVCLLGALSVYLIDSMLNFPISRPISHVYFLFILAAYQNLSNQDENNS